MSGRPVTIDVSQLAGLEARVEELADFDDEGLLLRLGVEIGDQMVDRIRTEKTTPTGAAWAPRSRSSGGSHPLLEKTGALLRSIDHVAVSGELEVGTPLVYGAVIHFGSTRSNLRARRFIGLSSANEHEVERIALSMLVDALGDAA
jgi:phage gpG-like protein